MKCWSPLRSSLVATHVGDLKVQQLWAASSSDKWLGSDVFFALWPSAGIGAFWSCRTRISTSRFEARALCLKMVDYQLKLGVSTSPKWWILSISWSCSRVTVRRSGIAPDHGGPSPSALPSSPVVMSCRYSAAVASFCLTSHQQAHESEVSCCSYNEDF